MRKELDVKYNIPNIKIFLSIFNLTLEEKKFLESNESLKIYKEGKEVGEVVLQPDKITLQALSDYGILEATTNYATASTITDMESFETLGTIGLYAEWQNDFDFNLERFNKTNFSGNVNFFIKIDNEFGNRISPHFRLEYQDNTKKYQINFQENGYPFYFEEVRDTYKEKIIYSLFDTYGMSSYIHHSKQDIFSDGENEFDYYESAFISKSDNNNNNTAIIHKECNDRWLVHDYQEFEKVDENDDSSEEIINKMQMMNIISPKTVDKIQGLIEEFRVGENSFLEKFFLYGFTNFNAAEVYSLFKLDKNNTDLEKMYFETTEVKKIGQKIFSPENK